MAATNNGHLAIVDILLLKGAKPDLQDKVSTPPKTCMQPFGSIIHTYNIQTMKVYTACRGCILEINSLTLCMLYRVAGLHLWQQC